MLFPANSLATKSFNQQLCSLESDLAVLDVYNQLLAVFLDVAQLFNKLVKLALDLRQLLLFNSQFGKRFALSLLRFNKPLLLRLNFVDNSVVLFQLNDPLAQALRCL